MRGHDGYGSLLFRAREDARASAARLRRLGFSVACLPAIETRAHAVRPRQSRYDAVVATRDKAFLGDGAERQVPAALCGWRPHRPRRASARLAARRSAGSRRRSTGRKADHRT